MKLRMAALLGGLAILAGCSNDPAALNPIAAGYAMIRRDASAPGAVTSEQIAQALTTTDRPLAFVNLETRKSQALILRIETNGDHESFATATRQLVVMRHGLITGTRGLGGDLMSTEEAALLALVRDARTGQASYVQRFLTPDDQTRVVTYRCGVEPDKPVEIEMGEIRLTAREVIAACESPEEMPFVDYFLVDEAGEILASRQWLGRDIGYVAMHRLRR